MQQQNESLSQKLDRFKKNKSNTSGSNANKSMSERMASFKSTKNPPKATGPLKKDRGMVTNFATDMLKTPARVATNVVGAGKEALNLFDNLSGKESRFSKEDIQNNQPFSGNLLGEVKGVGVEDGGGLSGANLKDSLGVGLEAASYTPIGRGASLLGKTAQTAARGRSAAGGGVRGFLKRQVPLAREGGLSSLFGQGGRSVQEGDSLSEGLKKTVGSTVAGTLGGPVLGAAARTAGNFLPKRLFMGADDAANVRNTNINTKNTAKFTKEMEEVAESIYPNISKAEKATITKKDTTSSIFGSKTSADFINDPKTKEVIEAVYDLPEDIKINSKDTWGLKDQKITQGINRQDQNILELIDRPEIIKSTTFDKKDMREFLDKKVLNLIRGEFGENSEMYRKTLNGIENAMFAVKESNLKGSHLARREFDRIFKELNPQAFKETPNSFGELSQHATDVTKVWRAIRNGMNEFNFNLVPADNPYRSLLRNEHLLLRAKTELNKRSTKELGKDAFDRKMDKNRLLKRAVDGVTTGGTIYVASRLFGRNGGSAGNNSN